MLPIVYIMLFANPNPNPNPNNSQPQTGKKPPTYARYLINTVSRKDFDIALDTKMKILVT